MKYVESSDLVRLSSKLSFNTPDSQVVCGIDLFTTKPAASDRKLLRTLESQLDAKAIDDDDAAVEFVDHRLDGMSIGSLGTETISSPQLLSPPSSFDRQRRLSANLPPSPFGPLDQGSSRKQYAYLISVLNASDPDRDFSSLSPDNFTRESSLSKVIHGFNNILMGLGATSPPGMWDTLDKHIDLKDCKMYSLDLPPNLLQDDPGATWIKMWFFFNKRRKRVVFMQLRTSRLYSPELKPDQNEDYDLELDEEVPVLGELEEDCE